MLSSKIKLLFCYIIKLLFKATIYLLFDLKNQNQKTKKNSIFKLKLVHTQSIQMKNSINNLRNQLKSTEVLTSAQLSSVKGGTGEDLRKTI